MADYSTRYGAFAVNTGQSKHMTQEALHIAAHDQILHKLCVNTGVQHSHKQFIIIW